MPALPAEAAAMLALKARLSALVVLLLLLCTSMLIAWARGQQVGRLQAEVMAKEERLAQVHHSLAVVEERAAVYQQQAEVLSQQLQRLRARSQAATDQLKKELNHDDAKSWAGQPVPGRIGRLLNHSASDP